MASATSERALRVAKRQQAKDRDTYKTVVTALMSTVDGRRWVWLELAAANLFAPNSSLDPYYLAYAEGLRVPALRLNSYVSRYTPTMYVRMMEENANVKLTDDEPDQDQEQEDLNG